MQPVSRAGTIPQTTGSSAGKRATPCQARENLKLVHPIEDLEIMQLWLLEQHETGSNWFLCEFVLAQVDLCEVSGQPKNLPQKPPESYATNYLKPRGKYVLVQMESKFTED